MKVFYDLKIIYSLCAVVIIITDAVYDKANARVRLLPRAHPTTHLFCLKQNITQPNHRISN